MKKHIMNLTHSPLKMIRDTGGKQIWLHLKI